MDAPGQLLIRSRAAIARFKKANASGNPAELAEARRALELCYVEVKLFAAAEKAMKSKKLGAPIRKITASADRQPLGNNTPPKPASSGTFSTTSRISRIN
jgi:hypothetical protein